MAKFLIKFAVVYGSVQFAFYASTQDFNKGKQGTGKQFFLSLTEKKTEDLVHPRLKASTLAVTNSSIIESRSFHLSHESCFVIMTY